MRIYVASSWRNQIQDVIVCVLRAVGHEVYDFKNPPERAGFGWESLDPNWQAWTANQWRASLEHPIARAGFKSDMDALRWCEACVLVAPCGRSAHLELGWATGAGKKTLALVLEAVGPHEPELMYSMLDSICTSQHEMLEQLAKWDSQPRTFGKPPPAVNQV